jgi:hypothetical protein
VHEVENVEEKIVWFMHELVYRHCFSLCFRAVCTSGESCAIGRLSLELARRIRSLNNLGDTDQGGQMTLRVTFHC